MHCHINRLCLDKLVINDGKGVTRMGILATEGALDVTGIMSSAVSTAQTEMMGILTIVVPAVAAITVAVVAVKFGMSWIKKIRG